MDAADALLGGDMEIKYVKGDATKPIGDGQKIIAHICNDANKWGSGFVMAVSGRWSKPKTEYHRWAQEQDGFDLGEVQFVRVEDDIQIANMIGQHGVGMQDGPPIRYDAVMVCLAKVATRAVSDNSSVHMPRIGCQRAGGRWDHIEPIIKDTLCSKGVAVIVYDY